VPGPGELIGEGHEYVHFTRKARLELTLGDILNEARALSAFPRVGQWPFCSHGV
jgi:hypothetical protein